MALHRTDTFYIPSKFRDIPEAKRAREAEEEFKAALERETKLAAVSSQRVHFISKELQLIQKKLKEAQDAFDAATGLPEPAPLTARVLEEVSNLFSAEQRGEAVSLLEKRCGRTIPFQRDADSISLEPYRLRVLRESKGDIATLKKWIEAANIMGRDILNGAER
jgi:hypothetical protein